jgi:3-hydroxy-9,10-secoandrosta-1,3,5(10)-triene-9,17-dione monooxygenase reductase component
MTPSKARPEVHLSHHNRRPEPAVFDQVLAAMESEVMQGTKFVASLARLPDEGIDSLRFRDVLSWFPTGVTVVTSVANGRPVGLTVGSFCSLSLAPAQVLFCATSASGSWRLIKASERFCVNVLAHDQVDLCQTFARPSADRFAGIAWNYSERGLPVIGNVLAYIDCDLMTTATSGDHDVAIGLVHDLKVCRRDQPLVFFRSSWGLRSEASESTPRPIA